MDVNQEGNTMGIKHELLHDDETLSLTLAPPKTGDYGYWVYDKVWGGNLSMRAKTERSAWIEVIKYYQERLTEIQNEHYELRAKVNSFVSQFNEHDED